MITLKLLFFILGCYGVTLLITQSKIFKPIREFFKDKINFIYELLNCSMCTGFWVGGFGALILKFSPSYLLFADLNTSLWNMFTYIIFDAAFISGMMWILHLIQLNLEKYVKDEI